MPEPDQPNGAAELQPPSDASAGNVSVQVSPQGHVTIFISPGLAPARLTSSAGDTLEGLELFGRQPQEAPAASPFKQVADKLKAALDTLGDKIVEFTNDVTSLEVRTFVSDRIEEVQPDNALGFTHSQQRAFTHIDFDGDTQVVVPVDAGQIDDALWRIHQQTVEQAQAHRQAMLRTIGELVSGFIPTLK